MKLCKECPRPPTTNLQKYVNFPSYSVFEFISVNQIKIGMKVKIFFIISYTVSVMFRYRNTNIVLRFDFPVLQISPRWAKILSNAKLFISMYKSNQRLNIPPHIID